MEFIYNEVQPVKEIVDAIGFLYSSPEMDGFWQGIAALEPSTQLDDPRCTPAIVSQRMRACTTAATVVHYSDEDSDATAYITSRARFVIHMNMKYRQRIVPSFINTLAHEFVHVVDCFADVGGRNGAFEYGHARRWTRQRPNSALFD